MEKRTKGRNAPQKTMQETATGRVDPSRLAAAFLHRSNSVGNEGRKRKDRSSIGASEVDPVKRKVNSTAYVIAESLEAANHHFQLLEKAVNDSKDTYKDIKDTVVRLGKAMEALRRESTKNWLDANKWEKVETPTYDVDCQTDLRWRGIDGSSQTEKYHFQSGEMVDGSSQTEKHVRAQGAKVEETDAVFSEAPVEKAKVVWTTVNEMKKRIGGKELEVGTAVSLSRTTGFTIDGEALESTVSTTWYLVGAAENENDLARDKSSEDCYKSLAGKLEGVGCKEIALTRDKSWEKHKKIMKGMACLRGFNVTGYRGKETTWSQITAGRQAPKDTADKSKTSKKEMIIVEAKEGYSQALKRVREDLAGAKVNVTAIRKTRAGDILVEAKGMTEGTYKVREALANHNIRIAGGKTPVVIRGLDALVSKEEVIGAVKGALGQVVHAEVADMWATFGDTRAVRVHTTRDAAAKLAKMGTLQVGPVRGRIRAEDKSRCFRCWGQGHRAGSCKGPDRSNKCFRCGEDGHIASKCKGEEQCLTCSEKGHRTGASSCKGDPVDARKATDPNFC